MKTISQFILRLLGWSIQGADNVLSVPKAIVAVAPHTSNWDFPLGILVRSASGINTRFLGKKSLFRPPLGWLFHWMGGYPVDRSKHTNLVDATAAVINQKDEFRVTIAPEGTRSKVVGFKTGFYYIAIKAQVPIILTAFDFKKKEVRFSEPFYPGNNYVEDWTYIYDYFEGVAGLHPSKQFVRPKEITNPA